MTHRILSPYTIRAGIMLLGLLAASLSFAYSLFFSPEVTVINNAKEPLENLMVSGSGFEEQVSLLLPGSVHTLVVRPERDSPVRLSFDTAAGRKILPDVATVSRRGGHQVTIMIDWQFDTRTRSKFRSIFVEAANLGLLRAEPVGPTGRAR